MEYLKTLKIPRLLYIIILLQYSIAKINFGRFSRLFNLHNLFKIFNYILFTLPHIQDSASVNSNLFAHLTPTFRTLISIVQTIIFIILLNFLSLKELLYKISHDLLIWIIQIHSYLLLLESGYLLIKLLINFVILLLIQNKLFNLLFVQTNYLAIYNLSQWKILRILDDIAFMYSFFLHHL